MSPVCIKCGNQPCVCGEEYKHLSDKMLCRLLYQLQSICSDRALAPTITILGKPLSAELVSLVNSDQTFIHRATQDKLPKEWMRFINRFKNETVFCMYNNIESDPELTYRTAFSIYCLHMLNIPNWKLFDVIFTTIHAAGAEYIYPELLQLLSSHVRSSFHDFIITAKQHIYTFRQLASEANNKDMLVLLAYLNDLIDILPKRIPNSSDPFWVSKTIFIINELLLVGANETLRYKNDIQIYTTGHPSGDYYVYELVDLAALAYLKDTKELIPLELLVV